MHHSGKENQTAIPERFTNPFRYFPDPLVVEAARKVIDRIDSSDELRPAFSEGKMLGILIVEYPPLHSIPDSSDVILNSPDVILNLIQVPPPSTQLGYLAAFSGSVGGRSVIEGFVPPIFNLLDPSGHFKTREAEITSINQRIASLSTSPELASIHQELSDTERDRDAELSEMRIRMAISKRERDEIRSELADSTRMPELIRQSQFEKAELKRLKLLWEERISVLRERKAGIEDEIKALKIRRSEMSDELQEWIFRQYIVHNSLGEESSITDIFSGEGLVPPGGTGECAAPKLLEYAFRNGLTPIAMGEFWYGKSPETAVRTHGHFYPSCTSKCGPLLGWMMKGLDVMTDDTLQNDYERDDVRIIYEDDALIAIDKPSGMPSVPGLDGRVSAFEILQKKAGEIFVVHRLDMDTSGVLVFAKTAEAAVRIQKQFESHTVEKIYRARLSAPDETSGRNRSEAVGSVPETGTTAKEGSEGSEKRVLRLKAGDKGRIELPLSPDYDERPRQKVDFVQGKEAVTDYEVIGQSPDGCLDILFRPRTGRTHQLRVHAAHTLGLARPILGDLLYGGAPASRLHLYATEITFRHPTLSRKVCIKQL